MNTNSNARMYWIESIPKQQIVFIRRANVDGSDVENVVTLIDVKAHDIALDMIERKVYWTDRFAGKIQWAHLDYRQTEDLITGLNQPIGIALDRVHYKIYWAECSTGNIQRVKLDGTGAEVVAANIGKPIGIAVDVIDNTMYWTDRRGRIGTCPLDDCACDSRRWIVKGLKKPCGIALDKTQGKVYWADRAASKIQRCNLDGGNKEDLVTGLMTPVGIALDTVNQKVYWTDRSAHNIQRSNLDGSDREELIKKLKALNGLTLDYQTPVISLETPLDGSLTNQPQQAFVGHLSRQAKLTINGRIVEVVPPENTFSDFLQLSEGVNAFQLIAIDADGHVGKLAVQVTLDTVSPAPPNLDQLSVSDIALIGIMGSPGSVEPGASVTMTNTRTDDTATVIASADGSFNLYIRAQDGDTLVIVVTDRAGNISTPINLPIGGELPPDPAEVAPPLDLTVATTVHDSTAFLYTGPNPIQSGVAAETIEPKRAAVLRGKVMNRAGNPLPGATVTVLNHPEYGQTLSRADGRFDMAINGGGHLTVNLQRDGYLTVQRQVKPGWQDYVHLPDVIMVQPDSVVTSVDLTAPTLQVARGSEVSDSDGTRQATLLIPQGTGAELVMADGSIQPATTLNMRATEFSIGERGPQTMPALLPPASGYTYALEYTVDEAIAAGAAEVRFSQPLYHYVEDFIGFPVGSAVPSGYYDRRQGQWIASDNGRVVKVLGVSGGLAELDIDGDGQAERQEALAELGISEQELEQLATLYAPGQVVWRVPITHFTPWDFNWPFGPPVGAYPPNMPKPFGGDPQDQFCPSEGSIIECQNQVLGERVPIVGTSHTLNYRSSRTPGFRPRRTLQLQLTPEILPPMLESVELKVSVAGRVFEQSFAPQTNLVHRFTWDGKDAFGRVVQGTQAVSISIGYTYAGVYMESSPGPDYDKMFGHFTYFGALTTGIVSRQQVTLWQQMQTTISALDSRAWGLGGWNLDVVHVYDVLGRTLYLGNGTKRSSCGLGVGLRIQTVGEASHPQHIASAPDDSLYITDATRHQVLRLDPEGAITVVAGKKGSPGYSGDGGPAIEAKLNRPHGIAIGADGSLYIGDNWNHRIRRIGSDGNISSVAGNGERGYSGDGGPATEAKLNHPRGVAVASDGVLYIADEKNHRIRRLGLDGIITTVAGTGTPDFSGDGGLASQADLDRPIDVAVGPDDALYITTHYSNRVRRIGPDGIINTVAGDGPGMFFGGDGGQATAAYLHDPNGITVGPDGTLYISDHKNNRIRKVDPSGIITTIAGYGGDSGVELEGDGGPATAAGVRDPMDIAIAPDGSLYILLFNKFILQVSANLPGFSVADIAIPSETGEELYQFDASGRHLRTLNALTATTLLAFSYDERGVLTAIEDSDGNVTTVERNTAGAPVAIIGPYGQRTKLSLDANGYLAAITNPAGEVQRFQYTPDGLLTRSFDPLNHEYAYTYGELGRITKTQDPAGGFKSYTRTELEQGYEVRQETVEGRVTVYRVEELSDGIARFTNTFPAGTSNQVLIEPNGKTTTTFADGTVVERIEGPDPRWGMLAPVTIQETVTVPSGLTRSQEISRTATLTDPENLLSLEVLTETVTLNDRVYTTTYDAAQGLRTIKSPLGRALYTWLDAKGRVQKYQVDSLAPVEFGYDSRGRLENIKEETGAGVRLYAITYDADGYVDTITDPMMRRVSFVYDATGRIVQQILHDSREIHYTYDDNSNVETITPPGRPDHGFTYTSINQQENYLPPDVGAGANFTHHEYNLDTQLELVNRPDGKTIDLHYDTAGRLDAISIPRGTVRLLYDPATTQLSSITAPDGGVVSYAWNSVLPIKTSWTGQVAGTVENTYDNDMLLSALTINGTHSTAFGYDDDGLLVQAGDMTLTRDSQNGFVKGTVLEQVTTERTYNGAGELVAYVAKYSGMSMFEQVFVRDKLGRITKRTETLDGVDTVFDYNYDSAGRLHEVWKDGTKVSTYDYDQNSNRTSFTDPFGTITEGSYDAQDRMLNYGDATYTYTDNGELATKTEGGATTNYTYDELGNLTDVYLPEGTHIHYLIDGGNRRIGKEVDGLITQGLLYMDFINPVAETDAEGNISSLFIYGTRSNVPTYMLSRKEDGSTWFKYRIVSDHLGSPRLVVKTSDGLVIQRIDYDEFGKVILDTNPGFQPFGFAGGIYDSDTGLVRFGARDYDVNAGRWTLKDPLGFSPDNFNFYEYSLSDPVNFIDPLGFSSVFFRLPPFSTSFFGKGEIITRIPNRVAPNQRYVKPRIPRWRMIQRLDPKFEPRPVCEPPPEIVPPGNPGPWLGAPPQIPPPPSNWPAWKKLLYIFAQAFAQASRVAAQHVPPPGGHVAPPTLRFLPSEDSDMRVL